MAPRSAAFVVIAGLAIHAVSSSAAAQCQSASTAWGANSIGPFSAAFTAQFDVTPKAKNIDGLVGMSQGAGAWFTDFAMSVRFNNNNRMDVRNGGTFAARTSVSYVVGTTYHFRVVADVATHKYDVYYKVGTGPEVQLAAGYAFRTEQQGISSVDNWGAYVDSGGLDVCNFTATAATTANQLPIAKASATPTTGAVPLAVAFDGSGSSDPDGTIASYAWNFGDGTSGSGAKVSHTYSTAGSYTARLTVTDNKGATASAAVSITAGSPSSCVTGNAGVWNNYPMGPFNNVMTAEFDVTPQATGLDGLVGLSLGAANWWPNLAVAVRFSTTNAIDARNGDTYMATQTLGYLPGTKYHFRVVADISAHTFDAYVTPTGGTEKQIAAGYAFRTEQATVSGLDNWNTYLTTGSMQVCNFVAKETNLPPKAVAVASVTTGPAPLAVTFDGSGSTDANGTITSYTWTFGDGTTGSGAKISHTYQQAGTYTAKLVVKDDKGATASATVNITATDATSCATGNAGIWNDYPMGPFNDLMSAEFDVTPQATGLDGLVGLSLGAANWWPNLAVAVRFSVTNTIDARNGDAYVATQAVSYAPGTKYHFRVVADIPAHTFDAYVTPAGGTEKQIAAGYAFRTEQAGVTSLDTSDTYLTTGTMQVCNFVAQAKVRNKPPVASGTVTPTTGEAPLTVQCNASGCTDPDGTIAAYQWDFGDGTKASTTQASHTYQAAGSYKIVLTATDNAGAKGTKEFPVSATPPAGSCVTSSVAFQNFPMTAQSGAFTVEFDATANVSNTDAGVGLSTAPAGGYADTAAVVRFNTAGLIDARNASDYSSDATLAYTAGKNYHVRMAVGMLSHTYSVYVTPTGGAEQLIAENYPFRAEQASVTSLANWTVWSGSDSQTIQVCGFKVGPAGPPTVALSMKSLDFGLSSTSLALEIWNAGGSTLSYSIADDANWLTVSPTSGSSAGEKDTIAATVSRTGLAAGTYQATITVTPSTGTAVKIPVTMQYGTVPQTKLKPIARWDVVPYQRINAGATLNVGVVAFSKYGIAKVRFTVNGQGYTGTSPIDVTDMTLNPQTGVYEYWTPISASKFATDGPFTIDAAVYGNDGGYRDRFTDGGGVGLDTLRLVVNATGKLPQAQAWVSPSGNDYTAVVGDSSRPYQTVGGAIGGIRNYRNSIGAGNNADGGIVRLVPGTHYCSPGNAVGPIACDNEWVTITTAAGGTRSNTVLASGGIVATRKIAVRGITLSGPVLGMSYTDRTQAQVWADDCTLLGTGRGPGALHPLTSEYLYLAYTGSSITEVAQATSGSKLCRGLTITRISDDAFQNVPLVINCVVDDIDPMGTGAHADAWQHGMGNDYNKVDDNSIVYGLRATNLKYQSIFIGGDIYASPTYAQGMAFVNVYMQMRTDSAGWGGWYRFTDHLLWWHCTFAVKGIGIMPGTYNGVKMNCSIKNMSVRGCDFAFFGVGGSNGYADVDFSDWKYNHYVDPSVTSGTNYTTGSNYLDSYGVPLSNSPLLDRFSPVVPVDCRNKLRSGLADVGAYER